MIMVPLLVLGANKFSTCDDEGNLNFLFKFLIVKVFALETENCSNSLLRPMKIRSSSILITSIQAPSHG